MARKQTGFLYFDLMQGVVRQAMAFSQMMVDASHIMSTRFDMHHKGQMGHTPYPYAEMARMVREKGEAAWLTAMQMGTEWQKVAGKPLRMDTIFDPGQALQFVQAAERVSAPMRRKVSANAKRMKKKSKK